MNKFMNITIQACSDNMYINTYIYISFHPSKHSTVCTNMQLTSALTYETPGFFRGFNYLFMICLFHTNNLLLTPGIPGNIFW